MISEAKTCELDTALQFIDLINKKRFCKHYDIKNTPAVWITGIIVIASNIVLCFCKCICCNRFWEYTRHKWTIVLVSPFVSILKLEIRHNLVCFFYIWKMNVINILSDPCYISAFCLWISFRIHVFFYLERSRGNRYCKY